MSRSKDDSTSRQDPSVSASVSDRLAGEAAGRLSGKVAIITGAGTGIGRASAIKFAEAGATVVAVGRRQAPLDDVVAEIVAAGGRAEARTVDIADARRRVGDRVALQGNLDPCTLYASPQRIRDEVGEVLAGYGHAPGHVFNLGHGIQPFVDPERVAVLVDAVHALSESYHQ